MQQKIFIKNKKGLKLAAFLHKPDKEGKFPAIVLVHGFTGYKDEGHIAAIAEELEKNDFVAIRFDTSGFGESGGVLEDDYRLSNQYSDIESVFEYIKTLDYVDSDKLGVWGNSLGGTLVIIFASNNPWVKAVCAVSVPTEFARKDNFERRTKAWEKTGFFEKESSRYGHIKIPFDFVTDGRKFNSLNSISKVSAPILFVLGTADENVYPENTKEIYNLANEPKQLVEIQGMKHDYKNIPEQVIEVNNHVVRFFQDEL